ncbi:hypothetical protein OA57_12200, partial [Chelonobacter oris]
GLSMSAQIGWITNLDKYELGKSLGETISKTLSGNSVAGTVCVGICGSIGSTILTEKPRVLLGLGVGGGFSFGADRMYKIGEENEK